MPVSTHLLERAYQLINANQLQNAELVLDAVVRVDPQNVDAWKTYLQIHQNQNDLDWLKERLLKTKELSEADKNELINYYYYLSQQPNGAKKVFVRKNKVVLPSPEKEATIKEETIIRFELIDLFDYPAKIIKKELLTRPRQRSAYTAFALAIARGAFKAILKSPFGKMVSALIQKTISPQKEHTALAVRRKRRDNAANDLVKNSRITYALFSKSPYFAKFAGVALLVLFMIGVRLIVSGYLLGYVFLGIFVIGNGWWLLNFGNHNTNQNRVYLHENKISLALIKEAEKDQDQISSKDDFEKTIE